MSKRAPAPAGLIGAASRRSRTPALHTSKRYDAQRTAIPVPADQISRLIKSVWTTEFLPAAASDSASTWLNRHFPCGDHPV